MTTKDLATTDMGETGLANWDEELARQASEAAAQTASAGGLPWFSLRGGQLKFKDGLLPDNQMAVIVLDAIIEYVYYATAFDPEDPQSPECYAFGRDEKTLAPHAEAAKPQCETCALCPYNQWGSLVVNGQQRRGKACRNTQRLGLIAGGTLIGGVFTPFTKPDDIKNGQIGYLRIPPTSLGEYRRHVDNLNNVLHVPPRAVFTKIALTPDTKSTFKVMFTALDRVPAALLGAVMERTKEVAAQITCPYQAGTRTEAAAGKGNAGDGKGNKKRKY